MDPIFAITGAAAFTVGAAAIAGRHAARIALHYRDALAARATAESAASELHETAHSLATNLLVKLRRYQRHDERVAELLEANNRILERARKAEGELAERREEVDLLETELAAARADAAAQEAEANRWAAIAHQGGYTPSPRPQ